MTAWTRSLTAAEDRLVAAAREKAWILYEGVQTPHRSCGIALAETFSLPSRPYQVLRRGGLSGMGTCGAVMGGRMVLGELLGDPDPTGPPTGALREAIAFFDAALPTRLDRMRASGWVCNDLTGQFEAFRSPERSSFCTRLATEVATLAAECLIRAEQPFAITPIEGLSFDSGEPTEPMAAMPVLPEGVARYRSVRFTQDTVPAGLLREHRTKPGVWARIVVEEGRLWYRIRGGLGGVFLLEPGRPGVAEPQVPHEVAPDGLVQFKVEFCRRSEAGS